MSLPRVSSNPHIRSGATTQLLMFTVILALMPAFGYGIYNFGIRALFVSLVCVASAVLSELVFALTTKKKIRVGDLSAVVTGLLLAMNLPVSIPFWQAALGSAFAIIVVKELFGGLGKNFMNPALAGRCFLIISFPVAMTNFTTDTYTGATPLALLKSGESIDIRAMVFGNIPGTIGETSMVMILIGACILLLFGVIDLWIPGSYILSFVIFLIIFGGHGFDPAFISAHLAGGGLMLGAFFMATDYVTRPVSKKGQAVFGIFLGIMTGIFRIFGPSAEGVSYAIILGNCLVPLIDKFTVPVPFGLTASEFKKGGR
ncbi:MAG: RnfABCDGE type electron transport complex subunit D [Lachnospiraceae bacterium]|nr:RnfABCDGE type electron transport complex subunit D [Lachnospiraceae bacterium]